MARLETIGYEGGPGDISNTGSRHLDNIASSAATLPTIQATVKRSGSFAARCQTDAVNGTTANSINHPIPAVTPSTNYFFRVYICVDALPTTIADIWNLNCFQISLVSTGALRLTDSNSIAIGSDSIQLINPDGVTWYRVEIQINIDASSHGIFAELRLDGVTVASGAPSNLINQLSTNGIGWIQAPGVAGASIYLDDYGRNDSTGANQNTWLGPGKIVLLKPISDNARAGFVTGAGGTTSLFNAVDNTPPVGVADTGTATSQIRDATSSTTDNYDANMTSYTTAGIHAIDVINCVFWAINHGSAVTTSQPARAGRLVSNPAEGGDTTLSGQTAVGTYPTGWAWSRGAVIYAPSVTKGTSPVLRIGKRTASTRIVDVDAMFIYVDYTPAEDVSTIATTTTVSGTDVVEKSDATTVPTATSLTTVDTAQFVESAIIATRTSLIYTEGIVYVEEGPIDFDTTNYPSDNDKSINNAASLLKYGQGFTPGNNGLMRGGSIVVTRRGTPTDTLVVELQNDTAGSPSGTVLASVTLDLSALVVDVETEVFFSFPSVVSLSGGSTYYFVTYRNGSSDAVNYWELGFSNASALTQAKVFN